MERTTIVPFAVYDYRKDVRNVIIMPEIRSRFLRMEPENLVAERTRLLLSPL